MGRLGRGELPFCIAGAERGGHFFSLRFPLEASASACYSGQSTAMSLASEEKTMSLQELTAENFQQLALEAEVPVLVDFWSATCGPCRRMLPVLEQLAAESEGRFKVFKVDVAEQPQLAARYQIYALPTLLIFCHGETAQTMVGYKEQAVLLAALERASTYQPAAT
jgi:thioredoxin 1